MENFFKNIKKTSYQEKALNSFLALESMNKSKFSETMGYINHMLSNNEPAGRRLLDLINESGGKHYNYTKNSTYTKNSNLTFLEEIDYGRSESILKKFKRETLNPVEHEIYDLRKDWHIIKNEVKLHTDKLKQNIITKEEKNSVPAIKKIYPEGIAKDSITEILLDQTTILKEEYIARTNEYADKSFSGYKKITELSREELIKKYPRNFINFKKEQEIGLSKKGLDVLNLSLIIVREGIKKYKDKKVYIAEVHYYGSIRRLVDRLNSKGIIQASDFKIETARVGINIETLIRHKDGKTTRAWTIVASGEIIAPHFRYLVK